MKRILIVILLLVLVVPVSGQWRQFVYFDRDTVWINGWGYPLKMVGDLSLDGAISIDTLKVDEIAERTSGNGIHVRSDMTLYENLMLSQIAGERFVVASDLDSTIIDMGAVINVFQIEVDNSELLVVDSTGLVGVGIGTPLSMIHVYEDDAFTSAGAGLTVEQDGTGDAIAQFLLTGGQRWAAGIDNSDADKYKISRSADLDSDPVITFDTSSNVGIGVTDPDTKVEILAAATQLKLSYDGTYSATFATGAAGDFTLTPSGGDMAIIASLGVGVATPSDKLHVEHNVNGENVTIRMRALTDGGAGRTVYLDWDPDNRSLALGETTEMVLRQGNLGTGTMDPDDAVSLVHATPVFTATDSDINLNTSSSAEQQDTSAVVLDASGEPKWTFASTTGNTVVGQVGTTGDYTITPAGGDVILASSKLAIGVAAMTNMTGLVVEGGVLGMKEITTPTADTNYGKLYTKTDNGLYFQDGAGSEHSVNVSASDYGEMGNAYGSTATEVIAKANEWYAMYHANIIGTSPYLNSGFAFTAGHAGAISATSTGAGATVTMTSAGHTLAADDWVTINGTTTYDGVEQVVSINGNDFVITATNSEADEGGGDAAFQEGSYLTVATTGIYRGAWTACCSQSDNAARTSIITPFINGSQGTKATSAMYIGNNADVSEPHGNGIMSFTAGDRIWFAVQSTDPQTITFTVRTMSLH